MKSYGTVGLLLALALAAFAQETKPLFENNFEQAEVGKVPEGFTVIDGAFAVKADGTNKFLELPGTPLDTFGVVFGPTEKADVSVSARIRGTGTGRRYPTFGVGLNGQGGYKLQVSPAKKALEIFKGEESVASAPFDWKSGEWTTVKLQVVKSGAVWKVEGKAWQGAAEPASPVVTCEEKTEPNAGRASLWGMPFSTTPIQFDDLVVKKVEAGK
jgi:hypothetical protein